ncbi:aldose 1-epimerase family protein [Fibrobacterota bacterium]
MLETIKNDHLEIAVESRGAELQSLRSVKDNTQFLWQAGPGFWQRRSPVLFPIVGKLENDQYSYQGKTYTMGQHGFARDKEFFLLHKGPDYLVYQLSHDTGTLKHYPFQFSLEIAYQLADNRLKVGYRVSNQQEKVMWFSVGGHPAFRCPLFDGESYADYCLELERKETAGRHLLDQGLLTDPPEPFLDNENIIEMTPGMFDRDAIIFKGLKSNWISLKHKQKDYRLTLDFTGFPCLGIWAGTGSPFVCLEPWFGLAGNKGAEPDFTKKEGIMSLVVGGKFSCEFVVGIRIPNG